MCGRVRLASDWSEIRIELEFDPTFAAPNLKQSWNIGPMQRVLVCRRDALTGTRRPDLMQWSLVPAWAKAPSSKYATFNARAETVATAPAFRHAWQYGRRCLVVTDGFYEWRKPEKQPFAISVPGALTVMAGLWEPWEQPGQERLLSCTIITTGPNATMAPLHNRMPVILKPEDWPVWLGETAAPASAVKALMRAYDGSLDIWPVGKRVGNVRNDGPDLVRPVTL